MFAGELEKGLEVRLRERKKLRQAARGVREKLLDRLFLVKVRLYFNSVDYN